MAGSSYTALDALYKQRYPDGLEDLTFRERPFYGLVTKRTDLGGAQTTGGNRAYHIPFRYAFPAAISGSFTQASNRAAAISSKVVAWELLTMHQYSFINIDNESLLRSVGNENAFLELRGFEFDGAVENLANRLHHFLYGNGTGAIAQVGNSTQMPSFATSVLVLFNSEDAAKFAYGDELTVSATQSGAERAFGSNNHGWYVIGVNMDAGTLTVGTAAGAAVNLNDAADGIPLVAALDWIAHRGDRQTAGTLGGTVLDGYPSWIPNVNFTFTPGQLQYTVDRSTAPDLLAGSRFDGTSYGIEEAYIRGANVVAKKQGKINTIFSTHKHYSDLVSGIAARGQVSFIEAAPSATPNVGYEGVHIIGANSGAIDVIPDYACPSTLGAGMFLDKWVLGSVGDTIHIMNTDNNETLRLPSADGVSAYWYSYANLVPLSPRDNVNILLPF